MGLFRANGKIAGLSRRAAALVAATLAPFLFAALATLAAAPAAQAHPRCAADSTVCYGINWQTIRPEQLARQTDFNVHARQHTQHSPLHYAAQHNPYPDTLRILIEAGANIEDSAPGHRPLHEAAWANPNPAILDFLIQAGASVQATTSAGLNLLHMAAQHNTPAVIAHLVLSLNFSPAAASPDGRTAAHHAAQNPRLYALQTLYALGANLTAVTHNGATPLHSAAARNNRIAILKYLQNFTSVTITDHSGATPLHYAAARNFNVAFIHHLVSNGAQPTDATHDGKTPLHFAADSNTPDIARAIISRLPSDNLQQHINQGDHLGYTPLHYAARSQHGADLIALLAAAGANPNRFAAGGLTPLTHALLDSRPWSTANAKTLIAQGARPTLTDYFLLGINTLIFKLTRLGY